jgi:hypothetical protein
VKTLSRVLTYETLEQVHKEIGRYERDNVGLEAAHKFEQGAEDAARTGRIYAKRRARTRPRRQAAKRQRRHVKAQADFRLRELARENPELRKNAFKRYLQKRRLKKEYQKQAKRAAARGAAKGAERTAGAAGKLFRAAFGFAKRHPAAALVISLAFLLVLTLQSCMSGAVTIGSGVGGGVGGTSYLAEDADIDEAELRYTEWETDLLIDAKNPPGGYDEYRYNIGDVGHDPYALLAFLTAVYDDFTFEGAEPVLREVFNEQYTLTRTVTSETRGSGEDSYTVRILTTTLTARSFSDIILPRIATQEQRARYGVYMFLKGNRQYVGKPFAMNWLPYVSDYYGYRVHPISGAKNYHTGVDIAVSEGTEILAGGAGTVIRTGNDAGGYGIFLAVDYGKGITALYAHCSALLVSEGQEVALGEVIALSGNTGNSTGAHLHMEVLKDGEYLNPLYYADGTQGV